MRSKATKNSNAPKAKIPFQIPVSWEWAPLTEIGWTFTGGTPKTSDKESFAGDVPFLGPGQLSKNGEILMSDKFLTQKGVANSTEALPGDILMVCIGGSIGKLACVSERCAFNQQINSLRPAAGSTRYFHLALQSSYFQKAVVDRATGSATPIINRTKWETILIPVPPGKEQERIAARVDDLLDLLNSVIAKVGAASGLQFQLADTLTTRIY